MMDHGQIMLRWGLSFLRKRDDIKIQGSPERCILRTVVETDKGLYVLEEIAPGQVDRKKDINAHLKFLSVNSAVHPYTEIIEINNRYWQAMPFINGSTLPQPEYLDEGWRGRSAGLFLKDIWKMNMEAKDNQHLFRYIDKLLASIIKNKPGYVHELAPVVERLDDLRQIYDELPRRFCHGDFHPINIIWGRDTINAVIDWEFCGSAPELYDMANMVGCVGFEHPSGLQRSFCQELIAEVRDDVSGLYWLPDMVLALRFAWLSEWLRKNDTELQELEIVYMNLLAKNNQLLKNLWSR